MKRSHQMSKSTPITTKRKDVFDNSREKGWDSSPNYQLPEYHSEKDVHCPRAMIRRFNKVKKENAMDHARRGRGASDWIEKTIKKKFEELPPPKVLTLREKALASAAVREESLTEVEILQKIIVRENLLSELQKLLHFQTNLDGIMSEVGELIRAVRYQTLEVIEEIAIWKSESKAPKQFYYRGQNYLLKLLNDTSFLDEYDDLGDFYGFYFTGNPLFYNGLGQHDQNNNSYLDTLPSMNTLNSQEIDGIQLCRLHDAERLLQKEAEMFQNHETTGGTNKFSSTTIPSQSSVLNIGEANLSIVENTTAAPSTLMNNSYLLPIQESFATSASTSRLLTHQKSSSPDGNNKRGPDGTLKPVKVVNDLKIKKARIQELEEEIAEIQAMTAHVEDQMATVNEDIQVYKKKLLSIERKKQEAISNGKTALAQKYMIEEGIVSGDIEQKTNEIKDFQRKKYFLDQERSRRKGLIRTMENEIKATTRQSIAKQKLLKKAKKEGILSALLSTSAIMEESKSQMKHSSDDEDEIVSYKISPRTQKKGETSFSDDEDDDQDKEGEGKGEGSLSSLDKGGSIFGFQDTSFESLINSHQRQHHNNGSDNSINFPSNQPLPIKKPSYPHQIISDIQIQSSLYSESVVTRSLEMMWFVMVAAEDVRPKKIAIRSFVKDVLAVGLNRTQLLKQTTENVVVNCLWEGYELATKFLVSRDQILARRAVGELCVHRSIEIAQTIVLHRCIETEKRLQQTEKILIQDLTKNLIQKILNDQVRNRSLRLTSCRQFINQIIFTSISKYLQNLQPKMCSYEKFHELLEENTIGSIGAAVYTVEMKVIPTRNLIKGVKENKQVKGVVGAVPVGTGYALAKAKKTVKDMIELEIYNLETKETITHLYHTENGEYAGINDAIQDISRKFPGTSGRMLFEETLVMYQTDLNIDGRTYNIKLMRNETKEMVILELYDNRMKTTLKIQLTKKQEKEIDNVRDISEYIQHLFQHTMEFLGYGSLREVMINKSGPNVMIGNDLLEGGGGGGRGGGRGEVIFQSEEEVMINYQPYNLKVTEDEIGIRIEVWNLKLGKVTGTRLTKRQERDFYEGRDRQQFLVNLLGTPGFAFLL